MDKTVEKSPKFDFKNNREIRYKNLITLGDFNFFSCNQMAKTNLNKHRIQIKRCGNQIDGYGRNQLRE